MNITKSDVNRIVHDVTYALTIMLGVHLMMYVTDCDCKILNKTILKIILFALLSIVVFHLIIKKIVKFK